jgi:hypothetical protein
MKNYVIYRAGAHIAEYAAPTAAAACYLHRETLPDAEYWRVGDAANDFVLLRHEAGDEAAQGYICRPVGTDYISARQVPFAPADYII